MIIVGQSSAHVKPAKPEDVDGGRRAQLGAALGGGAAAPRGRASRASTGRWRRTGPCSAHGTGAATTRTRTPATPGALVEPDLRRRDRGRRQVLAAAAELAGRALPDPWRRLAPAVAAWSGTRWRRSCWRLDSNEQPPFDYHAQLTYGADGRRPHHAALRRASRRRARSLRPGLPPLAAAHARHDARAAGHRGLAGDGRPHASRQGADWRPAGLGLRARRARCRRAGSTTASQAGPARRA